jgi:hypothetical protein
LQPKPHCIDAASQLSTYRPLRLTAGDQEDNLSPQNFLGSSGTGSDPFLKSLTFWRRENQSF